MAMLCGALSVSVLVAAEQVSGWMLSRRSIEASQRLASASELQRAVTDCGGSCPPYALVDAGGAWAAVAASSTGEERRRALQQAHALLDRAAKASFLARAWVQMAFSSSLDGDAAEAAVMRDIAVSYAASPFLPDRNHWRTRWASAHWDRLDAPLRARVLDEAAWLQSIPIDRGGAADGALGYSAAGTALAFRKAQLRR